MSDAIQNQENAMFYGEAVGAGSYFGQQFEWVDLDAAIERIGTMQFLGRFGDTIALCAMMGEDGDIYVIDDKATEESEESKPFWRAAEPDQVLVPVAPTV